MSARRSSHDSAPGIGAALARAAEELAQASETPRLDAEVLLACASGRPRSVLLGFPERALDPAAAQRFAAMLERRARGEPLAYVTGVREFFSLPLAVTPDVLIPRPETELIVELAVAALVGRDRPAVLDIGTGSGAIALAVRQARRDASVTASDTSSAALGVARTNSARLGLAVQFVESTWFERLAGQAFDLIVSNPPYVRSAEIRGALEHEPRIALDGGADGLGAYRALLGGGAAHLRARGMLLLEHGHDQRAPLADLAAATGWHVAGMHDDLAGRARVLALARAA